jgi:hypothetical protein
MLLLVALLEKAKWEVGNGEEEEDIDRPLVKRKHCKAFPVPSE